MTTPSAPQPQVAVHSTGDSASSASRASRARRRPRPPVPLLMSIPMLGLLLLPLIALITHTSPQQLVDNLQQPGVTEAIILSFSTTFFSTGLIVFLGTPLAYWLSVRRGRLARAIDTLVDLPLVLPPSVAGIALLLAFGRRGMFGQWLNELGITIAFTTIAVVLAQMFVASPFYIKAAAAAFGAIDPELKQAAALDGASGRQAFFAIVVPLSWALLISGSMMTWARALGEFGATILFAGNFPGLTQTMPLAIYVGFEVHLDRAVALSVVLLACSFAALALARWLLHRATS